MAANNKPSEPLEKAMTRLRSSNEALLAAWKQDDPQQWSRETRQNMGWWLMNRVAELLVMQFHLKGVKYTDEQLLTFADKLPQLFRGWIAQQPQT